LRGCPFPTLPQDWKGGGKKKKIAWESNNKGSLRKRPRRTDARKKKIGGTRPNMETGDIRPY